MTPHQHTNFDHAFWHDHWQQPADSWHDLEANPYVQEETSHLRPGTALDAGCGPGAEALWLAEHGWQVTGVDISDAALDIARQQPHPKARSVEWIRADLTTWEPERQWDLVMTSYAHTPLPQLEFYTHLADWVAPGGTLLLIAHRHDDTSRAQHPEAATVQGQDIVDLFPQPAWKIETTKEHTRNFRGHILHDVIVRVQRQSDSSD